MTKYENGKIYKIQSITGEGDIYIGSTTKEYLSQRMTAHRADYKRWKLGNASYTHSYDLFEMYGVDNCIIVLLECVHAKNKMELHAKEAEYIKNNACVNKVIPQQTDKEYWAKYYEANKDRLNAKKIQYNKENKESIKLKRQQFRANRTDEQKALEAEKKSEYDKSHRIKSRESIKLRKQLKRANRTEEQKMEDAKKKSEYHKKRTEARKLISNI